ncbi:MAG TPA: MMPL family transporter [Polyangia bacterium]|jgi:hypothetical protein
MPRLADFIVRRRYLILAVALVATVLAGWRASKLQLRTDFSELLPEKDPAVVVLREMGKRIKGLSTLVVVIESPDPEANKKAVAEVVQRVKALNAPQIHDIEWGVQREQEFTRHNKYLYASVAQLEDAHDAIRREILKRKNPAYVDLGGPDSEPLGKKREQIDKQEKDLLGRFPEGYFALKDRSLYAVVVRVGESIFGEHAGEKIDQQVRKAVGQIDARALHPAMKIGFTGDIISGIEERKALEDDLVLATGICVTLVCLVIFLFYGRKRAVPFAVIPALMGVAFAMAFAQLAFGYLNAATAFMASIIIGNGINYAIVLMARYEEERRAGRDVRDAMAIAMGTTWGATAVASLGAAIAYGSLAITSFRGFTQFGYIGFVGMVLSWLATFTVLPALWATFDHRRADQAMPKIRGFALAAPLGRLTVRHPKLLAGLGLAITVAAIVPLRSYLRDPFEYDFRNLRNQRSRYSGAGKLSYKLDPIFGRSLSPSFILADDPSQAEEIRRVLREQDKKYNVVGDIKTVNDFLPGGPAVQQQKLEILASIRKLIDTNSKLLDDKERADVLAFRPPDDLKLLAPQDLPISIRRYFTESDGTIGRPVAYYAREGISIWNGHTLIKLAAVTQELRLADGKTVRSSGSPAIFAGMMNCILRDGPIATVASFLGVVLLVVLLTFRRGGGGLMILGTLVVGVLWMIGAAAIGHVRINFLNFIALPIAFGIGVDYAVNLQLRYRLEGPGRVEATVAATGGAVALASLTTIIGYAALLVADNKALRSFGLLSIIGEFACLAAALLIQPAVLHLLERRRGKSTPPPAALAPSAPDQAASAGGGSAAP